MPLPLKELYKTVSNPHPVALDELAAQGGIAHVCIDVQEKYCHKIKGSGTDDTEQTARRVAKLTPLFRKYGVSNIWVYYNHNKTPSLDRAGFYHVSPEPDEILIPKNKNSAFSGSDIDSILKSNNVKTLLITGVNLNACVQGTVFDARNEKYNVVIITDAVGNDVSATGHKEYCLSKIAEMHENGISFSHPSSIFKQLKNGSAANQNDRLSHPVQQANETNDKTHSSTALRLAKLLPFVPFLLG